MSVTPGEETPESGCGHGWFVKFAIATLIFPAVWIALMQPWKLVLWGLGRVLPFDADQVFWVGWGVGAILAGWAALAFCRLIWPAAPGGQPGSSDEV